MNNKIENTERSAVESPTDFIADALVMGTSKAIEASESKGQKQFVNSDVLPLKILAGTAEELELIGIKLGSVCEGDSLFREVVLPEGWKKQATSHSMWSELLDSKGRKRASIFYKAAFYDRDAFINLQRRFTVTGYEYDDKAVVLDCDQVIYEMPFIKGNYDDQDKAVRLCGDWLENEYPMYKDFTKYWDLTKRD
jgi:hypothetical protein